MDACRFCESGNPCRFHRDEIQSHVDSAPSKNWLPDDLKEEFFRLGGGYQVVEVHTDKRRGRGHPGWKKKSLAEKQNAMKFKYQRGY